MGRKIVNIERVLVTDLTFDPQNARKHSKGNIAAIEKSLKEFGQRKPIVVTFDGTVVAGNGTLEAAKNINWTEIDIVRTPEDWSSAQIKAYAIADNRTAELAEWDNETLLKSLLEIDEAGLLTASGYVEDELKAITKEVGDKANNEEVRGELLGLLNVAYGEPNHLVAKGEVYEVGHHILVIADVMDGWKQFMPYLEGDKLFLPYPGPYAALATKLSKKPSVMVQPNEYLAGHLLDKYASIYGEGEIKKVKSSD